MATNLNRDVEERIKDFNPIHKGIVELPILSKAGQECNDCGVPWCTTASDYPEPEQRFEQGGEVFDHVFDYYQSLDPKIASQLAMPGKGCPAHRIVPEFITDYLRNLIVGFHKAEARVTMTGLTAESCHHPCQSACTFGQESWKNSVPIQGHERNGFYAVMKLAEKGGFEKLAVVGPDSWTGRKIAVVGSGPAGMQAARDARLAGHAVTIYESFEKVGGTPRKLVPQTHLNPKVLDFYKDLFEFEGVKFETGVNVGHDQSRHDVTWNQLANENDAVFLALGAGVQHNHSATPGYNLKNVISAAEILEAKNRELLGLGASKAKDLAEFVKGKTVLIVGAGYTADDVATTLGRMGAGKIAMIKRSESAPVNRDWENNPWPEWPRTREMEIPYATEEFGSILDYKPKHRLQELLPDDNGAVRAATIEAVKTDKETKRFSGTGATEEIACDLVVFATGFGRPIPEGVSITKADNGLYLPNKKFAPIGDFATGSSFYINALADAYWVSRGMMTRLGLELPRRRT